MEGKMVGGLYGWVLQTSVRESVARVDRANSTADVILTYIVNIYHDGPTVKDIYDSEHMKSTLAEWCGRLAAGRVNIKVAPERSLFLRGTGLSFHGHPEVFLQLGGSTRFIFPDAEFELHAGEVCIMPIGVPHDEIATHAATPFQTLVFLYMQRALMGIFSNGIDGERPSGHASSLFEPIEFKQSVGLLGHVQQLAESEPAYAQHVLGALLAITGGALGHPQEERGEETWGPLVQRCRQLVEARFAYPGCNVGALAATLRCTPNYLSAKFRREVGVTLTAYLNAVRMKHAAQLLESSELSISQVARCCGYEHPSYFIACFKKRTGQTPLGYRHAQR